MVTPHFRKAPIGSIVWQIRKTRDRWFPWAPVLAIWRSKWLGASGLGCKMLRSKSVWPALPKWSELGNQEPSRPEHPPQREESNGQHLGSPKSARTKHRGFWEWWVVGRKSPRATKRQRPKCGDQTLHWCCPHEGLQSVERPNGTWSGRNIQTGSVASTCNASHRVPLHCYYHHLVDAPTTFWVACITCKRQRSGG